VQAALMLGVFVTPVFYPASEYPRAFVLLLYPNPMAQLVGIWQGLLLNQHVPHHNSILWALVSAVLALLVGASVFAHHRKKFADLV
jgi:ABC-type polysaccharide/polyol phosphate export permease